MPNQLVLQVNVPPRSLLLGPLTDGQTIGGLLRESSSLIGRADASCALIGRLASALFREQSEKERP